MIKLLQDHGFFAEREAIQNLDARLQEKIARAGQADLVIECTWYRKPAAVVFARDEVVVVGTGWGREMRGPVGDLRVDAGDGEHRKLQCYGMEAELAFADPGTAHRFDVELAERKARITARAVSDPVPLERVTTLSEVPGHQIVRVVGAITQLSATSGFTATTKGNDALDIAMGMLRETAVERGANAIVGLSASAFGAAGGITSAFGGDAVGVLLIGTAVVVRPNEPAE